MIMKHHILTALREEFDQWQELLGSLGEEQITIPLAPTEWSIKDAIAHMMAWQKRSIARVQAATLDREPVFPAWPQELDPEQDDVDPVNAWIYETHRDQPWSFIQQEWRDGFQQFLSLAEAISEPHLLSTDRYPWMKGCPIAIVLLSSYDHHQEHFEKTLAWLNQHDSQTSMPGRRPGNGL